MTFAMAGGGTGGHVVPSLAVAHELRRRGHECVFIGVRHGIEARLVPAAGFPVEWIDIHGLQRTSIMTTLKSLIKLPFAIWASRAVLRRCDTRAVFSMGGYVAGPVMLAASWMGLPIVLMEPNAIPGLVSRRMARRVAKALTLFEETGTHFPPGVAERTGLPVREGFFQLAARSPGKPLTVLFTGGSRGSQALNRAVRASWPLCCAAGVDVRWVMQTGREEQPSMEEAFAATGLPGRVVAFIDDMPSAYGEADLVVGRSGAGACAELCAAGKPSVLVPFPFAADDHQMANARALERSGAAMVVPDAELSGERLSGILGELANAPSRLEEMGANARRLARPGAAARAADWLESLSGAIDAPGKTRNN